MILVFQSLALGCVWFLSPNLISDTNLKGMVCPVRLFGHSGVIFLIHGTVLELHRWMELSPVDANGKKTAEDKHVSTLLEWCPEDMAVQLVVTLTPRF